MSTLKSKRIEKGLTQKQVAKKAGICERQYIRIESGGKTTSVETAYRIAQVYGSSIEECFADILHESDKKVNQ